MKKKEYIKAIIICIFIGGFIFSMNAAIKCDENRKADTLKVAEKIEFEEGFMISRIDQKIEDRITGKSYKDNPNMLLSVLRYIKVLHYDFDGNVKDGELIVNKVIAEDIIDIFKELYKEKYPIERMVLIDAYNADDNTSCFNYRMKTNLQTIDLLGVEAGIRERITNILKK